MSGVSPLKLYTIGFTKRSVERFFLLLCENGIERLVDIRLHPCGHLAGFTKQTEIIHIL